MDKESKEEKEQKELLDPATAAVVGTGIWFVFKSMMSTVIGFIAVEWFKKGKNRWDKWRNKGEDETDNQEVSGEESENK